MIHNPLSRLGSMKPVSFLALVPLLLAAVSARSQELVSSVTSIQEESRSSSTAYDPLKVDEAEIEQLTLSVNDKDRSREIPIRVYLPKETSAVPVILVSHGLGGSRDNGPYLGKHWARRGYVVVFMQHPGSDESVWKEARVRERMEAMRKAASGENFMLRVKDVPAVIDQLEKWNEEDGHALKGRLDPGHIGMTGHSFGAMTTQAVSGQSFLGREAFTDPRIKCALPMSPSATRLTKPERSFGSVAIPWLLMTGTNDSSPINDTDAESRLAVYPALPAGSKYELVLDKAKHSAFTDRALPGERGQRNPNHHRAILAISTAFWDAYLKDDSAARAWLDGDEVRQILEPDDRWQKK
jgi:predicted dienelactone hydrolase